MKDRKDRLWWWVSHNRLLSALIAAGLVALVNAAVQVSAFALLVLAGAGVGCALAVVLPAGVAGDQVVRHSRKYRESTLGAAHRKELTRR